MRYEDFLKTKEKQLSKSGFTPDPNNLNPNLFEFQREIVKRSCEAGKYAIFADCGLGKTLMQLEWARQVVNKTNRPVLILCPLAVSCQTIREGNKFGIKVWKWMGVNQMRPNMEDHYYQRIYVTNYEQLENIDTEAFSGVVLDESSILKNFDGKMKNLIMSKFSETPYRLACTATPSPNDPMELGNHSEFLDVMGRNEMLAMYFVHDGGQTSKWRLKKHARPLFYKWVGEWATMIGRPSDIGFHDDGYDLPSLNYFDFKIQTEKKENGMLFNEVAVSATNFNQELRLTKIDRMNQAAKIVNESDEPFIVWIKQNEEGDLIRKLIPDAVEVRGNEKPEAKEAKFLAFQNGEFRVLVTKAKIAQFGLNFQHCRNQVFASLDFSFEGLYQAVRRSYRFGQKNEVNIYIISTDTMQNVVESINRKQKQFNEMREEMTNTMNDGVKSDDRIYNTDEVSNECYTIRRGDCVQLIDDLPDESVGFSVFSPPFADLYTYSNYVEDMGNSSDWNQFMAQFKYLVRQLFRVVQSGRNVAVHCMDLPIQKGKEGFIGLRDFSGLILRAFQQAGFIYHSRITIWKDPVVEMQRTKALGLLHKQVKKDSTMSRVGIPDYVMVFRKDGERKNPVTNTDIPVDLWQKIASPVWMDINYTNTLQYTTARDNNDEKHICPLQLDTIERLILLYTNKGDTVLTPFMGISSEIYQAVKMGRKGIGFELKPSYYEIAKKNMASVVEEKNQTQLF